MSFYVQPCFLENTVFCSLEFSQKVESFLMAIKKTHSSKCFTVLSAQTKIYAILKIKLQNYYTVFRKARLLSSGPSSRQTATTISLMDFKSQMLRFEM